MVKPVYYMTVNYFHSHKVTFSFCYKLEKIPKIFLLKSSHFGVVSGQLSQGGMWKESTFLTCVVMLSLVAKLKSCRVPSSAVSRKAYYDYTMIMQHTRSESNSRRFYHFCVWQILQLSAFQPHSYALTFSFFFWHLLCRMRCQEKDGEKLKTKKVLLFLIFRIFKINRGLIYSQLMEK